MTKEYAIAIRLNSECTETAQSLNQAFATKLKSLENPRNIPHITLYHLACDPEDLPALWSKVQTIYTTANRWIDWQVAKTELLYNAHAEVVRLASPYHKEPLKRCVDTLKEMTEQKQQQVAKYGVSGVLQLYSPHVTLFYQYPPSKYIDAAVSATHEVEASCVLESIILGELGYNGNITNVVHELSIL